MKNMIITNNVVKISKMAMGGEQTQTLPGGGFH